MGDGHLTHDELLDYCLDLNALSSTAGDGFSGEYIDPSLLTQPLPLDTVDTPTIENTSSYPQGNRSDGMKRKCRDEASGSMIKHHKPEPDKYKNAQGLVQYWLKAFFDSSKFYFPSRDDIGNLAALARLEHCEAESLVSQELHPTAPTETFREKPGYLCSPPPTEPPVPSRSSACPGRVMRQPRPPSQRASLRRLAHQSLDPGPSFTQEKVVQMTKQYLDTRKRDCNTGQRHCTNRGRFQCTSKCGFRAAVVDSWKRHEENRQPQALWICKICRDIPESTSPFLTHRVDKIGDHLRTHVNNGDSKLAWKSLKDQSLVSYHFTFKNKCGFCRVKFATWTERNRHIIGHFNGEHSTDEGPRDIKDWNDEWSDDDDDEDDDDDDNDDDDDDEDDGGYGGDTDNGNTNDGADDYSGNSDGNVPGSGPLGGYDAGTGGSGAAWTGFSPANWSCSAMSFRPGRVLGYGSHAVVEQIKLGNGDELALKRVKPTDAAAIANFEREAHILGKLRSFEHPNIVRLETVWRDQSSLNMVLRPMAKSDLQEYLHSPGPRQRPEEVMQWVGHLASALKHLHKNRIRHADIKPANILVEDSKLFISDFSISREVKSEPDSTTSSTSPSTPMYAAPEIALVQRHGRKADIFSLGCVYLELVTFTLLGTLTGLHTYLGISKQHRPTYQEKLYLVARWIAALRQRSQKPYIPLLDLCGSMLERNPALRPDAARIVEMAAVMYSSHPSIVGWCAERPVGLQSLRMELKFSRIGAERHKKTHMDPINIDFFQPDAKLVWPYKALPESSLSSKTYKAQPRQLDLDLIGLVDQSQIEALPVYPGDLDCVLSDAADEDIFAKVLQPDNDYGQLPHERWLHGTNSPPYLPASRLPRPIEAETQGIFSQLRRRTSPINQTNLPKIDIALSACCHSPCEGIRPCSNADFGLDSHEQREASQQQSWSTDQGSFAPSRQDWEEHFEQRHDFTSRWHLRTGSWGSQSRFSHRGARASPSVQGQGRARLKSGEGGSAATFTGNEEACPEAQEHPALRHRTSSASLNSKNSDFRPYGRHANQWLFGDFSVRAVVRDAWGRTLKRRRVD